MPVLGITGGIATGKTSFTKALLDVLPGEIFDADAHVHDLLNYNPEVRAFIRKQFGADVFDAAKINRHRLREIVFHDESMRKALEEILHPAVRQAWSALAKNYKSKREWLFVDIPLLFETASEKLVDSVVAVACSAATQLRRLTSGRSLTAEMAEKIIATQVPLDLKIQRADIVIWNDGAVASLQRQAVFLAGLLRARYE